MLQPPPKQDHRAQVAPHPTSPLGIAGELERRRLKRLLSGGALPETPALSSRLERVAVIGADDCRRQSGETVTSYPKLHQHRLR
jgi:hypothetical protein